MNDILERPSPGPPQKRYPVPTGRCRKKNLSAAVFFALKANFHNSEKPFDQKKSKECKALTNNHLAALNPVQKAQANFHIFRLLTIFPLPHRLFHLSLPQMLAVGLGAGPHR